MRSLFVSAIVSASMLVTGAYGGGVSLTDQRFDVSIRDQDVRSVLAELSAATSVPIIVSDAVSGRVNASFEAASAADLLDRIAAERALDWRFDGRRVEVTARSEQTTRILDLDGVRVSGLSDALTKLGVYDDHFPITAVDGEFAMIVAPPSYTAIVEVVLGALIERRKEALAARADSQALAERRQLERARAEATLSVERERAELEETRIRASRSPHASETRSGDCPQRRLGGMSDVSGV